MKVHVMDLNIGDQLLHDTFNAHGLHILSSGTTLTQYDIAKLLEHQITYIDIQPYETDLLHEDYGLLTEDALRLLRPIYDQAIRNTKSLYQAAEQTGRIDHDFVKKTFSPIASILKQQHDVVDLLLELNIKDDYTYQHSIQVGMLSYYIAKWNNYSEEEAQFIAIAGYLHDIGKCRIDSQLLQRSDKLAAEEESIVAKHTQYGYEIIINSNYPYTVALAALQHHERMDGSGYPMKLSGSNISPYAKIVMVADHYSNHITNCPNQIKQDLFTVLQNLYDLTFSTLDPVITHNFISHMLPNFIGKKIQLDTDEVGKILLINYNDFFRPLIQIDDHFINLSAERQLKIKQVIQ